MNDDIFINSSDETPSLDEMLGLFDKWAKREREVAPEDPVQPDAFGREFVAPAVFDVVDGKAETGHDDVDASRKAVIRVWRDTYGYTFRRIALAAWHRWKPESPHWNPPSNQIVGQSLCYWAGTD